MPHQLNFKMSYRYQSLKGGIVIPAVLTVGELSVDCDAKIDTGAEYCLFERDVGEALELDLESGHPLKMVTLSGSIPTYGHEVTLQTFDFHFDVMVYFAAEYGTSRNFLGRHGWLQMLRVGLIDHDEIIYLSAYNEAE